MGIIPGSPRRIISRPGVSTIKALIGSKDFPHSSCGNSVIIHVPDVVFSPSGKGWHISMSVFSGFLGLVRLKNRYRPSLFMAPLSYSQPPPSTYPPVSERVLLPVFPPPEPVPSPKLPSPPRKQISSAYTSTVHIFPAAYLRHTIPTPIPQTLPKSTNKADRLAAAKGVVTELSDTKVSLKPEGYPQVLWNCATRYVKKDLSIGQKKRITLLLTHANGFPKETWEPTLHYLFSSSARAIIDEVWTWESIQHGDACLLNAGALSGSFDWADDARDLLNFLLYYLPSSISTSALPTSLPRQTLKESQYRMVNGFSRRTIIVAGHSFGGCTAALAAMVYPVLFSSLVLVDAIICKPNGKNIIEGAAQLALGALLRHETWPSREDALQTLRQNSFFKTWDPRALDTYVECGTYSSHDDHGRPLVRLKMPGIQEAIIFSERQTAFEVWQRLPHLDEAIELYWIVPGKAGAYEFGPVGSTQERVWLRPTNALNVRIPNAGHLIPQEAPRELATEIEGFLQRRYSLLRANL